MTESLLNTAFGGYLLCLALHGARYVFPREVLKRAAAVVFVATWVVHGAYLGQRWIASGYAPLSNQFESLVTLAWLVVLSHLILFRRNWGTGFGFWTSVLVLGFLGTASLLEKSSHPLVPALQSNWLLFHVVTTLMGYSALGISFLAAGVYLACRRKTPMEEKSLAVDELVRRSMTLGFVFLTVGIVLGAVWANEAWGTYWSWDPKETWSLITWFFFAIALHLRRTRAWKGERFSWLALGGFGFVLFTYFGVNYLLAGLHSYA